MSIKGIANKTTSNITKMTKRIGYKMKFYKFQQRLKYKCDRNNIGFKLVDEKYTSKVCSHCGYKKEDLGGNKVYKCDGCKKKIDRDVNGCRGIYIKSRCQ